jgi:hypothetical protein
MAETSRRHRDEPYRAHGAGVRESVGTGPPRCCHLSDEGGGRRRDEWGQDGMPVTTGRPVGGLCPSRPAAPRMLLSAPPVMPRPLAHERQAHAWPRHLRHWLIREPTLQSRALPGQDPAEAARMRTAHQDATTRDHHGDRPLPRPTVVQARRQHGACRQTALRQGPLHWWRDVPGRSRRARRVSRGHRTGARQWPARAAADPHRSGSLLCAGATKP